MELPLAIVDNLRLFLLRPGLHLAIAAVEDPAQIDHVFDVDADDVIDGVAIVAAVGSMVIEGSLLAKGLIFV